MREARGFAIFPGVNEWRWVGRDGFEYVGDRAKLEEAVEAGDVGPTTLIWSADADDWRPLSSVLPELSPKTQPLASPAPLPAFEPEDDAPTMRDNPIPEPSELVEVPRYAPPPPPKSNLVVKVVGVVGGAFVLGTIVGLLLFARGRSKEPTPRASATAAVGVAPAKTVVSVCKAEPAKRLSKHVSHRVGLEVALVGDHLALGFAESEKVARALRVDPDSLDAELAQSAQSETPIVGVVVAASGSDIDLKLDVKDPDLRSSHTVLGKSSFAIGATKEGIARRRESDTLVIWPGEEKPITVPRVETLPGIGHFVAFRWGGRSGEVAAGWLDPNGRKKTDLKRIELGAHTIGTPAIAASSDGVLLLVAARIDEGSNWQIAAGRADVLDVPAKLGLLPLGDESKNRISPAATRLGPDQWLVQWTEGPADSHEVRVGIFDDSLRRRVKPIGISPQGADAGQGVVWSDGKRIVSFFLVSTGNGHQLWAARVSCK